MKIAYLSAVSGHGAATTNMIITALMSAFNNRYKSVLFQCGDRLDGIDQYLLGSKQRNNIDMVSEIEYPFYYGKGVDALLKKVSIGKQIERDQNSLKSCCVEVVSDKCFMLPSSIKRNPRLYNEQMNQYINDMLSWCNREFDLTFVDNKSADEELFNRINEDADLIIINTSQNPIEFEEAINLKRSLGNKPSILMIGRYEEKCKENLEYFRKKYKLSKQEIFSIPYDRGFMSSMLEGQCNEYIKYCCERIKKGIHHRTKNNSYNVSDNFLESILEAYTGIFKYVEVFRLVEK